MMKEVEGVLEAVKQRCVATDIVRVDTLIDGLCGKRWRKEQKYLSWFWNLVLLQFDG